MPQNEAFLFTCGNNVYEAKKIILAFGRATKPALRGEVDFLGRGVSYCATCDGMLYKGRRVVVIDETSVGEEAHEEVMKDVNFLREICSEVTLLPRGGENAPISIEGGAFVEGLITKNGTIACDGVFFIKASVPPQTLLEGLETENGHITVSRKLETSVKGVFAAGDCVGAPYQVAKAVSDGLIAALNACS
jgi:thioredoxin reductase (NADPH)